MSMLFVLDNYHRNTPDSEFIADLKRVANTLQRNQVTIQEYRAHGKFHPSTLQRRFGSWFKALEAAGLQRTRTLGITSKEYFENLESVWRQLGRQPRYAEMRKPLSQYSAGAYEDRFGSWTKALKQFVELANAEGSEAVLNDREVPGQSRAVPGRHPSWRLRFLVMHRDGFRCQSCGRSPANQAGVILVIDHNVPWTKGGQTTLENLITRCQECNGGKGNLVFS